MAAGKEKKKAPRGCGARNRGLRGMMGKEDVEIFQHRRYNGENPRANPSENPEARKSEEKRRR
ncbi:MAG: hypothetical protein IJI09_11540 [Clostridia bacterium]|nr:hypothetical protein [Clostridia bacterium]